MVWKTLINNHEPASLHLSMRTCQGQPLLDRQPSTSPGHQILSSIYLGFQGFKELLHQEDKIKISLNPWKHFKMNGSKIWFHASCQRISLLGLPNLVPSFLPAFLSSLCPRKKSVLETVAGQLALSGRMLRGRHTDPTLNDGRSP